MDGEPMESFPTEEPDGMESQTDWWALQEKTDEEIEKVVQEDPNATLLDEEWFQKAELWCSLLKRGGSQSASMKTPWSSSSRVTLATKAVSTTCWGPT